MAMTAEEWNELTRDMVAAVGDQSVLTALATKATDEYVGMLATHENTSKENEALKAENEKLRKANLDLFLRVGEQAKPQTETSATKSRGETITIDDLFKEDNNGK